MTETVPSTYGPSAIITPANAVTVIRIIVSVPFLIHVAANGPSYPAMVVGILIAVTDGIDGYLARRHGTTRSGAFLDPLADKVLVLGTGWALVAAGEFWWLPVAIITVRELGISGLRSYYVRNGLAVPARKSAKVKTVVQEVALGFALAPFFAEEASWFPVTLWWVAVALTIYSGAQYVFDGRSSVSRTGDRA